MYVNFFPRLALILIFDPRHISSFRQAVPVDSRRKWKNSTYVTYKLAKAPHRIDWYEYEEE